MFRNNSSFKNKRWVVVAVGSLLVSTSVPFLGLAIYGAMLKIGQADNQFISSNEAAP